MQVIGLSMKDEQQAVLTIYQARSLLVSEPNSLVNRIRGLFIEYEVVLARGVTIVR